MRLSLTDKAPWGGDPFILFYFIFFKKQQKKVKQKQPSKQKYPLSP